MLFLFGAGRSFLEYNELHHSSFDNDYIYMFVNYGLLGLMLFTVYLFSYLLYNFFRFECLTITAKVLYMVVFSGEIISLGLAFFIDLKVLCVLAILIAIKNQENCLM